jgi:hypothetical protein
VCYKISIISHPHQEMLMRTSLPHHRSVQLTLFHPPQAQPAWRLFPIAVQQVATKGSVSKVEIATPMGLIYKALFPSISTFETPPPRDFHTRGRALAHEVLLANLFPRDTAAMAALDSPGSCIFNNGIGEAQFSALGGSPTVSP